MTTTWNINLFSRKIFLEVIKKMIQGKTRYNEYKNNLQLETWAKAQRYGRPAEYRWRPLFNATKFGWHPLLECRAVNAAKTWNPLKFAGVPQTRQQISAASEPKSTIL